MRKQLLFMLLLLPILAISQVQENGLFLHPTSGQITYYDSLGTSDDSLISRSVSWPSWGSMKGGLTINGKMWMQSGTQKTMTIKLTPILSGGELGYARTLGTRTVPASADSVSYQYNISGESWWLNCKGFKVSYTPSATGSLIKIKGGQLAR